MTNFMFIVIVAIVLIALVLFFTPFGKQLRVKFKGRTDEVMRQDAQTAEGARDYYNAAIREKEDFYNKASATYAEISGKRDTAEKDLYQANKDIMRVTQQINACLDENKEDEEITYTVTPNDNDKSFALKAIWFIFLARFASSFVRALSSAKSRLMTYPSMHIFRAYMEKFLVPICSIFC